MTDSIVLVDTDKAALVINDINVEKGYLTTAGLYDDVYEIEDGCFPVTIKGEFAEYLPVCWPEIIWTDDRGINQKILSIDYENDLFIMADGYHSKSVEAYYIGGE